MSKSTTTAEKATPEVAKVAKQIPEPEFDFTPPGKKLNTIYRERTDSFGNVVKSYFAAEPIKASK